MSSSTRHEAPPSMIRRSMRLIRRTKPIEAAAESVSEFETATAFLQYRYDQWARARHNLSVAIGAQHEAQDALDEQIRAVGMVSLAAVRGRRGDDDYRKYFPDGYGSLLRLLAQDSVAITAGLLAAIHDETDPDILSRRGRLAAARAELSRAIAARHAAVAAVSRARALLDEGKLSWRMAYQRFYFDLRNLFFGRRKYVNSFFRVDGNRRPEDDEAPPEIASTPQEIAFASEDDEAKREIDPDAQIAKEATYGESMSIEHSGAREGGSRGSFGMVAPAAEPLRSSPPPPFAAASRWRPSGSRLSGTPRRS